MDILDSIDQAGEIDFHKLWMIAMRRRMIVLACVFLAVTGALFYNYNARPVYRAQALVLIEREMQNNVITEGVKVNTNLDDYYQTQYEIIRSRSLSEAVAKDLQLDKNPDYAADPAGIVQASISVVPVKRSRLINLQVDGYNPKTAADISNTLSQRFIEQNVENRTFLSKEVLRVMDPATSTSFESLPAVVNNPLIQKLKSDLIKLQMDRAELSKSYKAKHPSMIQLEAQIHETQAQLDKEISHIANSVKIQLSGQLQGRTVRVIDPARIPGAPFKPQKTQNLVVALIISLVLGLALAYLVDTFDLSIRSPEDFEEMVKLPCLGMLNQLFGLDPDNLGRYDVVWKDNRSHAAENFRNIRTALSFRLSNIKGSKILLVTSTIQGEGKSFISVNLARVFAQNGARVLLIDGDLRRPSVHKVFAFENERGLSNVLTDADAKPEEFIMDSGVKNLGVIPCGPIPDSPAELLTDSRLKPILEWAARSYDLVIVDSPPVFPVTDALLWAKQVHGVVFVVQSGKARVAAMRRAIHTLKSSFANVIGGVLNQISLKAGDSYGYYYRYYYGKYISKKDDKKGGGKARPPVPAES